MSPRLSGRLSARARNAMALSGCLVLIAFVPACGVRVSPASSSRTPASAVALRAAHLFNSTQGWELTGRRLARTDDGGTTWADITPTGVEPSSILRVDFSDPSVGWAVASGSPVSRDVSSFRVLRTQDGGYTWSQSNALTVSGTTDGYGQVWIASLGNEIGWISVQLPSGSAFSVAKLFQTLDGGMTWRQLTVPIAGRLRFFSPINGWVAGGAGGNQLYVTRDGGQSWQAVSLRRPTAVPADWGQAAEVGLPSFLDSQHGVVASEYESPLTPQTLVYFDATSDAGQSWVETKPVSVGISVGELSGQYSIVDTSTWLLGVAGKLYTSNDGGSTWSVKAPDWSRFDPITSPSGQVSYGFDGLLFPVRGAGWAAIRSEHCLAAGPSVVKNPVGCATATFVVKTSDGGASWIPINQ